MARYGNNHRGGRPRGSVATHTLEASVAKQRIVDRVSERVDDIVAMLMHKALKERDVTAAKELLDRAYGKPKQEIEGDLRTALVLAFDGAFSSGSKMTLEARKEPKRIPSRVIEQTPAIEPF